eukprot:Pgem_evm1s4807
MNDYHIVCPYYSEHERSKNFNELVLALHKPTLNTVVLKKNLELNEVLLHFLLSSYKYISPILICKEHTSCDKNDVSINKPVNESVRENDEIKYNGYNNKKIHQTTSSSSNSNSSSSNSSSNSNSNSSGRRRGSRSGSRSRSSSISSISSSGGSDNKVDQITRVKYGKTFCDKKDFQNEFINCKRLLQKKLKKGYQNTFTSELPLLLDLNQMHGKECLSFSLALRYFNQ